MLILRAEFCSLIEIKKMIQSLGIYRHTSVRNSLWKKRRELFTGRSYIYQLHAKGYAVGNVQGQHIHKDLGYLCSKKPKKKKKKSEIFVFQGFIYKLKAFVYRIRI